MRKKKDSNIFLWEIAALICCARCTWCTCCSWTPSTGSCPSASWPSGGLVPSTVFINGIEKFYTVPTSINTNEYQYHKKILSWRYTNISPVYHYTVKNTRIMVYSCRLYLKYHEKLTKCRFGLYVNKYVKKIIQISRSCLRIRSVCRYIYICHSSMVISNINKKILKYSIFGESARNIER